MSYTPWSENALFSAGSDRSIANMATLGVDTVALNVWAFQDDEDATDIALDFDYFSASIPSIEHAIDQIHAQGMRVMLKPMVDLRNGVWRAHINPSAAWFAEYESYMNDWATFAEAHGVEMLSVGCEFNQPQTWEAEWRQVVAGVRARYSGPITYAANHDSYASVAWWDAVDYIGIDAYFPLTDSYNASPAELVSAWQARADSIEAWRSAAGLAQSVLFTEVGYQSADGAARTPWGVESSSPVDLQEQADAYQALLSVMTKRSWFDGAFWWSWETNPLGGGPDHAGFTPHGKPAEAVLASYYGGTVPAWPGHAPSQTLFSWEDGLEGWRVTGFNSHPATVAQSDLGATDGAYSLAVSQTVSSGSSSHFSWDAMVSLTDDQLFALQGALLDDADDYRLECDVTYRADLIPQESVTWMSLSLAFNNANGDVGWSQVSGLAVTDGHTDETIHVEVPLASWTALSPSSNWYQLVVGLNGDWGAGTVTVLLDNLRLVNIDVPLAGDYSGDGVVDAADYTVWRDSLGEQGAGLPADGDGDGEVTEADYVFWRERFGNIATSGSLTRDVEPAAVPEPTGGVLVLLAVATAAWLGGGGRGPVRKLAGGG